MTAPKRRSETWWVIVIKGKGSIIDTFGYSNPHDAIASLCLPRNTLAWPELRRRGYRCVRATLTWEEPK